MNRKFTPLFERVLLKPEPITEQIKGSIILPTLVQDSEPLNFGTIISVGHKCEVLKESDRVIYPKSCGTPIKVNDSDEDYLVMFEKDIVAIN